MGVLEFRPQREAEAAKDAAYFLEILSEVRWELDLRGHADIDLFVSGGIDENAIHELNAVAEVRLWSVPMSIAWIVQSARRNASAIVCRPA